MSLDHILLGLLREPASGYDLKAQLDHGIGYFWAAELSQIYPTLKRLEKKGWLRSRRAPSKRGPGRRVYETTSAGRKTLAEWLSGGPRVGDERQTYLAQIYLMDELGDLRRTLRFLLRLRDHWAHKLELLRQLERRWEECDPRFPDALTLRDFHKYLTLRKGLLSLETLVKWCEESTRRARARLQKEEGHGRSLRGDSLAAHRRRNAGAAAVLDTVDRS